MKHIAELSEQEILALSDEQIEAMVLYRSAEEGVKLLPRPIAPEKPDYKGDLSFFKVDDIYFEKMEDAQDFSRAMLKGVKADWQRSGLYSPENINEYSARIEPAVLFSKKLVDEVKTIANDYHEQKERFEKDEREFDKNERLKDVIRDEIWSRVREVKDKYDVLEGHRKQYQQYVTIAEGDVDMAWAFFEKAYGTQTEDDKHYITSVESNPTQTA